jgi:Cu/Ag efflux pump CusA
LREKVDEVLTGGHGALVVRVFGPDLEVLGERAQVIAERMRTIEGTRAVAVELLTPVPQLEIRARPEAASVYGLSNFELRRQVTTLVQGLRIGEVVKAQKPLGVVVWGTQAVRADLLALRDLRLVGPAGEQLRLGDIADVEVVSAPGSIRHEGGSRRLDVTCEVEGRALSEVAGDVDRLLADLKFPPGHHAELLGEYAAQQAASRQLMLGGALALIGIMLVLYIDFGSVRTTALVGFGLPFALVGAVAVVTVDGGVVSLGALVGFVTVVGVAARNGIMLVSHYRHLELHEGAVFGLELVVRATVERLSPILMTALSTALALLPLALAGDRPGHEIEHPMALVILGGLLSSTLLNLLVTPVAYLWLGRPASSEEPLP